MKKLLIIITTTLTLLFISAGLYWYFYTQKTPMVGIDQQTVNNNIGFTPFTKNLIKQPTPINTPVGDILATSTEQSNIVEYKLPKLRQLSVTPIAGIAASSTASSSLVRFMERGTGHIYETNSLSSKIEKISNTTIPKIYESYANKNGTNFIVRYLKDKSDIITNFYTELRLTATSTKGNTLYGLKGRYLSSNIKQLAVSPSGDKLFTWNIENDRGVGYISSFDEKNKIKVVDTPITQVNIDWPEKNTLVLSTKASSVSSGFIYTINAKTGVIKDIIGGLKGLTGKISGDASKLFYSEKSNGSFSTSILDIKNGNTNQVIFKTLSDKCVWSNLRKNEIYCAVPTEIPSAFYPDDWYKGSVSFVDQIWHLDTITGEVHMLANLLKESNSLIDATKLTLDPKEDTLYFINKRDLNLWALDLNQ